MKKRELGDIWDFAVADGVTRVYMFSDFNFSFLGIATTHSFLDCMLLSQLIAVSLIAKKCSISVFGSRFSSPVYLHAFPSVDEPTEYL